MEGGQGSDKGGKTVVVFSGTKRALGGLCWRLEVNSFVRTRWMCVSFAQTKERTREHRPLTGPAASTNDPL